MTNQAERFNAIPDSDILAEMQSVGALGPMPDGLARDNLEHLTHQLLANNRIVAESEYERFVSIQGRSLDLSLPMIEESLEGKRVLVTGGTGCIGRILLATMQAFNPSQIVSVEASASAGDVPGVEYASIDLRDEEALKAKLALIKPDTVYHLAAQRNVAMAQENSLQTLTTNILGTHNLLDAAERAGVSHMVYASSDKAMPPLVTGAYAISKKAGEWLMSGAALRGRMHCTAVRLTHVADNSVIFGRLSEWVSTNATVNLFNPDIHMRVQSATEAAQLLLGSCVEGKQGSLRMQMLKDTGRPVSLLHLALGAIAKADSSSPICFSGSNADLAPGLDIFRNSSKIPLAGEFEAPSVSLASFCDNVASLAVKMAPGPELDSAVNWLATYGQEPAGRQRLRAIEASLSRGMFRAVLRGLDEEILSVVREQSELLPPSRENFGIRALVQDATNKL